MDEQKINEEQPLIPQNIENKSPEEKSKTLTEGEIQNVLASYKTLVPKALEQIISLVTNNLKELICSEYAMASQDEKFIVLGKITIRVTKSSWADPYEFVLCSTHSHNARQHNTCINCTFQKVCKLNIPSKTLIDYLETQSKQKLFHLIEDTETVDYYYPFICGGCDCWSERYTRPKTKKIFVSHYVLPCSDLKDSKLIMIWTKSAGRYGISQEKVSLPWLVIAKKGIGYDISHIVSRIPEIYDKYH